jgi:small conductance mechanosensitive channel
LVNYAGISGLEVWIVPRLFPPPWTQRTCRQKQAPSMVSLDNIRNLVGNGKIFGDVIQNFSTNAFRRLELTAQLLHEVNPHQAMSILKGGLAKIPNVLADPAPSVETLTFNLAGPVLEVIA